MLVPMLGLPLVALALVLSASASRRSSEARRRLVMVAAIVLACTPLLLMRTDGLTSSILGSDFHWRWTPTAEERLLAEAPELPLASSFVAMPLAGAAGYFPLTIAGIGPRDVVLKELYVQLGVSEAHATAVAFAFLFAVLASGLVGGVVQLVRPIGIDDGADK